MSLTHAIEFFTAINVFIIGLSHMLQPKVWVDFFLFLHSKKQVGNIFNALISLGMGSFILSLHFVWEWPAVIVTVYGLLQLIKGSVYLLAPSVGLKSIGKVSHNQANKFAGVGIIMVILSIIITYNLVIDGAFGSCC